MVRYGAMMLKVYSKESFVNFCKKNNIDDTTVESTNASYICIDSSGGPYSEPYFKNHHYNVLNLRFDDVAQDTRKWGDDIQDYCYAYAPTSADIEKIYRFIEKINIEIPVHIHCTKGQSRSVAIKDFIEFKKTNKNPSAQNNQDSAYELLYEGLVCLLKN